MHVCMCVNEWLIYSVMQRQQNAFEVTVPLMCAVRVLHRMNIIIRVRDLFAYDCRRYVPVFCA